MFVIKKLVPSIDIEGKEKEAGIIYVNTKNNIIDDVEEEVNMHGGLAHAMPGGIIALFFDGNHENLVRVAGQILQKTKELGLRSKIGIHKGRVITEEIPGHHIKYSSLGGSVNMAKKIAIVENGIIMSEDLYKEIGKGLRTEKIGNGWLIKGVSEGRYK